MKLQKIHAYSHGDKQDSKYIITLQEGLVEALKWEPGSELEAKIQGGKIEICFVSEPPKNKKPKPAEPNMPYAEFRDKIKQALEHRDNGMTWTELRDLLGMEQVVPNNKCVRRLESDIGLKRVRDAGGVVWSINHV